MKNKKAKSIPPYSEKPSEEKNSFDMVNQYGTYNIQPTCSTENEYPQIGQCGVRGKKEKKQKSGIDKRTNV